MKVRDLPFSEKKVVLIIERIRFRCPFCSCIFLHDYDFVGKGNRFTYRYGKWIYRRVKKECIKTIAEEENVSWSTIQRIVDKMEKIKKREESNTHLPFVIGLDEVHNRKGHDYLTVVTDLKNRKILSLVNGRDSKGLKEYFKSFLETIRQQRHRIFVIDRWKAYRNVIEELFPEVPIIADKFHLIRDVQKALDELRKDEQRKSTKANRGKFFKMRFKLLKRKERLRDDELEKLKEIFEISERLKKAYNLKEKFRGIFNKKSDWSGYEEYQEWIRKARKSGIKVFQRLARSFER